MSGIESSLETLSRIVMWIAAFCLAAMMLHVFADVTLKYLFNAPIPGTLEIVARYYMVAAVFLPLPFVEIRNAGISVDLFYAKFGRPVRRLLMFFAYLGQALFFSLLAYQSSLDALQSFAKRDFVDGAVPIFVWPAAFMLPVGFALASIASVLRVLQVLMCSDWERLVQLKDGDDHAGLHKGEAT